MGAPQRSETRAHNTEVVSGGEAGGPARTTLDLDFTTSLDEVPPAKMTIFATSFTTFTSGKTGGRRRPAAFPHKPAAGPALAVREDGGEVWSSDGARFAPTPCIYRLCVRTRSRRAWNLID